MAILFLFTWFVFLYQPLKAYRRAVEALQHHREYTLLPDDGRSETRGGERMREKEKAIHEAGRKLRRGLMISVAALVIAGILIPILGWDLYLRIMVFHGGKKIPQIFLT